MNDPQAKRYGEVFGALLAQPRTMDLSRGTPNMSARDALEALTPEAAFEGRPIADEAMARATLAGVWLYHDFLDESHQISQGIADPTGSYWHGIMHRREPDYPNAKHWFRQTGEHPVFEPLHEDAVVLAQHSRSGSASKIQNAGRWDPFAFVDLCAEAANNGDTDLRDLCLKIQMREWWLLFDYCYNAALGRSA